MITATEAREVESVGMLRKKSFSIKIGSQIMQLLSGLYADPVSALFREYFSNARDGHIALRKIRPEDDTLPVQIKLPHALSPVLVIRDNGIGMSFDTVWNVYATYGETTKSGNNDEVGGMGVGSKAGFCYNNGQQWIIESRFEGQKHTFAASVGDDGIPDLSHIASVPTTEHSGVTISIPIRSNDFESVQQAAEKFLPYFDIPVEVEGMEVVPQAYAERGETWGIREKQKYDNDIRVIMGNVPYPVSASYINRTVRMNNVDLFAPIGSLKITPSRDSLMYDNETIAGLQALWSAMENEYIVKVNSQLALLDTRWQVLEYLMQFNRGDLPVSQLEWKGATLTHTAADGVKADIPLLKTLDNAVSLRMFTIERKRIVNRMCEERYEAAQLSPKHSFIMMDDIGHGAIGILRSFLMPLGRGAEAVLVSSTLTAAQWSEVFGGFPLDRIIKASAVATTKVRKARTPKNATCFKLDQKGKWRERVLIPTTQEIRYYVPLKRHGETFRWYSAIDLEQLEHLGHELGIDAGDTIYGIPENIPVDTDWWIRFDDHMSTTWIEKVRATAEDNKLRQSNRGKYTDKIPDDIGGVIDPLFAEFAALQEKRYVAGRNVWRWFDNYRHIFVEHAGEIETLFDNVGIEPAEDIAMILLDRYPMLQFLNYMPTDEERASKVREYIAERFARLTL